MTAGLGRWAASQRYLVASFVDLLLPFHQTSALLLLAGDAHPSAAAGVQRTAACHARLHAVMLQTTFKLRIYDSAAGGRCIRDVRSAVPYAAAVLSGALHSQRALLSCRSTLSAQQQPIANTMSQRGLLGMSVPMQHSAQLHAGPKHSLWHPFHSCTVQQHSRTLGALSNAYRPGLIPQHISRTSAAPARFAPAAAAAASAHTKAAARPKSFLDSLSAEQLAAVQAQEQHVRVIAGEKQAVAFATYMLKHFSTWMQTVLVMAIASAAAWSPPKVRILLGCWSAEGQSARGSQAMTMMLRSRRTCVSATLLEQCIGW